MHLANVGVFISPVCYSCMHMKLELIKPRAKAFSPANKHTQTVKSKQTKTIDTYWFYTDLQFYFHVEITTLCFIRLWNGYTIIKKVNIPSKSLEVPRVNKSYYCFYSEINSFMIEFYSALLVNRCYSIILLSCMASFLVA